MTSTESSYKFFTEKHLPQWLVKFKFWTLLKFHCYIVAINKHDEIPDQTYLAKHKSLIMLLISEKYFQLCPLSHSTSSTGMHEQYIWAEMPLLPNLDCPQSLFNNMPHTAQPNLLGYQNVTIFLENMFYTVPLLKSVHRQRSLFLITGCHNIIHESIGYYSMFAQLPKRWANGTEQPSPPLRSPEVGKLLSRFDKYNFLNSKKYGWTQSSWIWRFVFVKTAQ